MLGDAQYIKPSLSDAKHITTAQPFLRCFIKRSQHNLLLRRYLQSSSIPHGFGKLTTGHGKSTSPFTVCEHGSVRQFGSIAWLSSPNTHTTAVWTAARLVCSSVKVSSRSVLRIDLHIAMCPPLMRLERHVDVFLVAHGVRVHAGLPEHRRRLWRRA